MMIPHEDGNYSENEMYHGGKMTATQSQIRDALSKLDDHILGHDIKTNVDKYCCYLDKEQFDTVTTILQSALDTQKPAGDAAELEKALCGDDLGRGGFIGDLCYTVWVLCHNHKNEDGNTDWFNDTLPTVEKGMAKVRDMLRAALNGDCGGGDHPPIEGLEAAINNSITYPMVNDVGFQSEHDRRVVMQAARRYLALTADNAKRGE